MLAYLKTFPGARARCIDSHWNGREIGRPVVDIPGWYDVDDASSLRMLERELAGERPPFTSLDGAEAPATRQFMRERRAVRASMA
jgi:hypothetical protein